MARKLGLLPCSLVGLDLAAKRLHLVMQSLQAIARVLIVAGGGLQDGDLLFDVFQFALCLGARFQVDEVLGGWLTPQRRTNQ